MKAIDLFNSIGPNIPGWILYVVGIVLASRRRKQYPLPSRLTFIGCVVLLVGSLLHRVLFLAFTNGRSSVTDSANLVWMLKLGVLISVISYVVGLGLLLSAVYADRGTGGQSSPSLSAEERLSSLKDLFDKGSISDHEYQASRQSIVDSL